MLYCTDLKSTQPRETRDHTRLNATITQRVVSSANGLARYRVCLWLAALLSTHSQPTQKEPHLIMSTPRTYTTEPAVQLVCTVCQSQWPDRAPAPWLSYDTLATCSTESLHAHLHRNAGIAAAHTPIIKIIDEENSMNYPGDTEDMLRAVLTAYRNISPGDYMLLRCYAHAGVDTTMFKRTATYNIIDTAAMYRAYRCEAFSYHDFIAYESDIFIDEIGYSGADPASLARRLALNYTAVAIPQDLDEEPFVIAPHELSTFNRPFVLFAKKGAANG